MTRPILTDDRGVPFRRPAAPPPSADAAAWVDYVRALHDYNDAVAAAANRGFGEGLRAGLGSSR